jgi:hypothetical protein
MKAISFVMLVCLLLLSVIPARVMAVANMPKKDCCHKMASAPCGHSSKKACDGGMCATMLSCGTCCFVKTEPIIVAPITATFGAKNVTPYRMGHLSDYSITCWNPPKV